MITRAYLLWSITLTYDPLGRPMAFSSATRYSARATIAFPPRRLPRPIRIVILDLIATRARRTTTLTRPQAHQHTRTIPAHALATQMNPHLLCLCSRLPHRPLSHRIRHAFPHMRSLTPHRTHTPSPTPPACIPRRRTPTHLQYPAPNPRSMLARFSFRRSPR